MLMNIFILKEVRYNFTANAQLLVYIASLVAFSIKSPSLHVQMASWLT